jgi:hypothetical protein
MASSKPTSGTALTISAPNFHVAEFTIRGTAPYVQNKFSAKAREMIRQTQEAGSTARSKRQRDPKDFVALYEGATHKAAGGWCGIPAPAFRSAMIEACRMVGYQMTRAKMSVFIQADGFDADDGTPLVRFTKGEPHYSESPVRNQTSIDIRPRPMWDAGWEARLLVQFDGDQFTLADVANLLQRAGVQVGVGEGRPFSKDSAGMGWGTFTVVGE